MRKPIITVGIVSLVLLTGAYGFAEPWDLTCSGAIAKLNRTHQNVKAKQRDLVKAESEKRLAQAEAEVCKPGGIMSGARIAACAKKNRAVPLALEKMGKAEAQLQDAVVEFQEAFDDTARRCQ